MCDRRAIATHGNEDRNAVNDDHCADKPNCLLESSGGESPSVKDENRDLDQGRGDSL